ncbi:hypothetical protein SBDP1_1750002 [Syntrophobacter sp. SbD1]|nr:hypothetical protein SBDP1_1750002 [Syntrophobacter sp. SbD1]
MDTDEKIIAELFCIRVLTCRNWIQAGSLDGTLVVRSQRDCILSRVQA